MAQPQKDIFSAVFLDLLSSGLGAAIILMLIFSLHMTGLFSSAQSVAPAAPVKHIGDASLATEDTTQIDGTMGTIRFVTISGITQNEYDYLAALHKSVKSFWVFPRTTSDGTWKGEPADSFSYYLEQKANTLSFYAVGYHIRGQMDFRLPHIDHESNWNVRAGIIEGRTNMPDQVNISHGIIDTTARAKHVEVSFHLFKASSGSFIEFK